MVSRTVSIALVAMAATACTKTIVLKEDTPVGVTAQPPAPEPEPEPPKRVEVKKEKIQVNEKIHFEFDSAKIRSESHDLLDEIASVINDHPEILRLRVEGHTDSQGKAKYNLRLSKRRSKAVRDYLVNTGNVSAGRLETEGYGLDRPIASNETDEGRAKNRRVEFNIMERDDSAAGKTADADDGDEGEEVSTGAEKEAKAEEGAGTKNAKGKKGVETKKTKAAGAKAEAAGSDSEEAGGEDSSPADGAGEE